MPNGMPAQPMMMNSMPAKPMMPTIPNKGPLNKSWPTANKPATKSVPASPAMKSTSLSTAFPPKSERKASWTVTNSASPGAHQPRSTAGSPKPTPLFRPFPPSQDLLKLAHQGNPAKNLLTRAVSSNNINNMEHPRSKPGAYNKPSGLEMKRITSLPNVRGGEPKATSPGPNTLNKLERAATQKYEQETPPMYERETAAATKRRSMWVNIERISLHDVDPEKL
eukprot:4782579-Pyramimonas_sp.AAC.2